MSYGNVIYPYWHKGAFESAEQQYEMCKRWREESGPWYAEMDFWVLEVNGSSAHLVWTEDVSETGEYPFSQMSYPSQLIAAQSKPADLVTLKLRIDYNFIENGCQ